MPASEVKLVRYAALLRDVGKASVPHRVLNKQGELTEGELRVVPTSSSTITNAGTAPGILKGCPARTFPWHHASSGWWMTTKR